MEVTDTDYAEALSLFASIVRAFEIESQEIEHISINNMPYVVGEVAKQVREYISKVNEASKS